MRTLTEIRVNNQEQDAIIGYFTKALRIENAIVWVDEMEGLAKCQGDPRSVTIYVKDPEDYRKVTSIEISAASIIKLYALIKDIENQRTEEVLD